MGAEKIKGADSNISTIRGWHVPERSEGRGLRPCHALRSSERATRTAQLILAPGRYPPPAALQHAEGNRRERHGRLLF